jgi:NADPH:quinone reductase-like Zn-dependent oxidoreductase
VTPAQFDGVRALGATPIDYTSVTPADYVRVHTADEGFDVVYDTVGGATLDASFVSARRYTGHVVSALGWGTHALAPLSFRGATYSGVFTLMPLLSGKGRAHHGDILAQVTRLVDAGQLRPRVDTQTYTLKQVGDAHARLLSGQALGKVVVDIH